MIGAETVVLEEVMVLPIELELLEDVPQIHVRVH
jgi:hypothetical protein